MRSILFGGFFLALASAFSTQFLVAHGFSGSDCSGALLVTAAVELQSFANLSCVPVACSPVPVPAGIAGAARAGAPLFLGTSYSISCAPSMPSVSLPVVTSVWAGSSACSGRPSLVAGARGGMCVPSAGVSSQRQSCGEGGNFRIAKWLGNAVCEGEPTLVTTEQSRECVVNGRDSVRYGCNVAACFHESTKIAVAGWPEELEMRDVIAGRSTPRDCVVPHSFVASGVRLETACAGRDALRVTPDHLVYVRRQGQRHVVLLEAGKVAVGDALISTDEPEQTGCRVTAVENEHGQLYAGLNCLESTVSANGFLVSTFGTHHLIPAMWMRVMGTLVGVQRASAVGDVIASRLQQWGLL